MVVSLNGYYNKISRNIITVMKYRADFGRWVLMFHDPPLHEKPCCDPITSSFKNRDLISLLPIGLLYLVAHPVLYKEIEAIIDNNL